MIAINSALPRRVDNRRQALVDAAAHRFGDRGFQATSMRELAKAVGMLPGSVYYHFPSKDELLVEVYRQGVERICRTVQTAVASRCDPWERLEAGCAAHLESLLDGSDYVRVVIRVLPKDAPRVQAELDVLRHSYETVFRELVSDLRLAVPAETHYLRLFLLGAMNWAHIWYRPDRDSPHTIARQLLTLVHDSSRPHPA